VASDLADAGDPDADGASEFWVAGTSDDAGWAWLMDGPLDGDVSTDAAIASVDLSAWGESWVHVASGDLDGDGTSDLVVGSGHAAPGEHAALFLGPPDGRLIVRDAAAVRTLAEPEVLLSVASGDVNGDGHDDMIVVSQPLSGSAGSAVFVFHGPVTGEADMDAADARLLGASFYHDLQTTSVADLDGDGVQELLVGSPREIVVSQGYFGPGECWGLSDAGAVWVVSDPSGTAWLGNAADLRITGGAESWVGPHVAADVDGDGTLDFAVGAPHTEDAGVMAGAGYLFSSAVLGL
jgi:hypothetical protein